MSRRKRTAKTKRLELRAKARRYGVKVPARLVEPLIRLGEAQAAHQLACYRAVQSDIPLVVCETCHYAHEYLPLPWTRKQEAEILAGEPVRMMPCKGPFGDGGCPGEMAVSSEHWEEAA